MNGALSTSNASLSPMAMAKSKSNGRSKGSQHRKGKAPDQVPSSLASIVYERLPVMKSWREFHVKKAKNALKPATIYRTKRSLNESSELGLHEDSIFYPTYQGKELAFPVMLVDGYNVCGYWDKMKEDFAAGRLDIARQKLIDKLFYVSAVQDLKVVVVFDAMMSGLPPQKQNYFGIDVIFPGKKSADTWIIWETAALKADGCPDIVVVTSDKYQQQAAYDAGAFYWSCKTLIEEIINSEKEYNKRLCKERARSMLENMSQCSLRLEDVAALKALKKKLEQESQRNSPE